MKAGEIQFRETRSKGGAVDFISTRPVASGVFRFESDHRLFETSFFYEGEGDRLLVRIDRDDGLLQILKYASGYSQVLCQRRFARRPEGNLQIAFSREWIEVRAGERYLASSYLEGGMTGYLRIPGEKNGISSSARLSVQHDEPTFKAVFFGDGFTGGNWPHVNFWMYPDLLLGGKDRFLNAGVSAANTRKILEISREVAATGRHFERIVLMVGVDDVIDGILEDESKGNYREIVEVLNARCDALILCSLTPRFDELSPSIVSYNQLIKELAAEKSLTYADVYSSFLEQDPRSLLSLGDFPNAEGQKVIARCLAPHFSDVDISSLNDEFSERPRFSRLLFRLSQKFLGLSARVRF